MDQFFRENKRKNTRPASGPGACWSRCFGKPYCRDGLAAAGLAIIGEAFLKFLACEEDAALDCTEGEIHVLGNLVVFVAGDMHREGDAVFVGERFDGGANLTCAIRVFG